ncbi:MAG TPA: hypothetical protein VKO85_12605 [Wenzhouxiangellaceae bacterium]|nr:hypothetical protein [Wenzhouxiangellaceae bacterium]
MLMISTGDAHADQPAPGASFSNSEADFDRAWLEMEIVPEPHASILYLSYNFLTAESPEFAAAGFTDSLVIDVRDRQTRRNLVDLDARDPRLKPVSHADSMDTGFALFADDPSEFPASVGVGQPVAAMSGWKTVAVAIDAGGPVTLRIELRDEGDSLMDSAVVIGQIVTTSILHPSFLEATRGPDCLTVEQWCDTLFPPGELSGPLQEFPPRVCSAFFDDVRASSTSLREPRTVRGITQPGAVADGATRWPLGFGLFNDDGPLARGGTQPARDAGTGRWRPGPVRQFRSAAQRHGAGGATGPARLGSIGAILRSRKVLASRAHRSRIRSVAPAHRSGLLPKYHDRPGALFQQCRISICYRSAGGGADAWVVERPGHLAAKRICRYLTLDQ